MAAVQEARVIEFASEATILIRQMMNGGAVMVEPCATPAALDTTVMCKYADPRVGCAEKAVGGLIAGSDNVECPIQRGVLRVVGSNGAVKIA